MTEEETAARAEMRRALVVALMPLAINVALLVVITKRDEIARIGMRIKYAVTNQRRHEQEDVAVAQLRREIAQWEHAERDKG